MVETTVRIDGGDGFWHRSGDTYVRGRAFLDGELYRPADLLALVRGTPAGAFDRLVADLNGFFSIVRETDDAVQVAVDRVQSFPLFYAVADGEAYVSNDARWIEGRLEEPRVDPLLELEFLLTGTVTGRDTLYPEIKQLEAGEVVTVDRAGGDVSVRRSRHSRFDHRAPLDATEADLLDEMDAVCERAFRRLVEVADGRQLAVSLSGGPDCRLIACMLRRLGYDDFVAFTYGREGNWDSTVATEVADALEIPLETVRYDHDTWYEWFRSDERVDYYRYAFNFEALPSIGAVPAVGELQRRGALDDDAVILCGNLLPTRYDYKRSLQEEAPTTEAELAAYLVERYYDAWEWDEGEAAAAFESRIESQVALGDGDPVAEAVAACKDWRVRNRHAKLHVKPEEYAFWGYDSWTPLWDGEFARFWERVPLGYREGKRLHLTYVDRLYRELAGEAPPDDHDPGGPIQRLERAVAGSALDRFVRPIYERFEAAYKAWTRESPFHRDPVATMGIMTEAQFEALRYAHDQDVHPFKALELLGCVSFDPPENHAGPVDGVLSMEALRTDDHARRRESLPWMVAGAADGREAEPVAGSGD